MGAGLTISETSEHDRAQSSTRFRSDSHPGFNQVPGVVIDHSPKSSGIFIGSPSIAILPDGSYVASHDYFGRFDGQTAVFGSTNRGAAWQKLTQIPGQYWSTLFVHDGALYLLGTSGLSGKVVIRRSRDGGKNWTVPSDSDNGLLLTNGSYHCAPVPVVAYRGHLWRAFEHQLAARGAETSLRTFVLSVQTHADLLCASNWTASNELTGSTNWLGGAFGGWLEGNAVVAPDSKLINILRVDTSRYPEKAAGVRISDDGLTASFEPASGFVSFPGGAKKFTIRYDAASGLYWSLATIVPERHQKAANQRPGEIRNTLALICSPDLTNWTVRCVVLYHPDTLKHGFQYVDWLVDGGDIIAVCRTAWDDGLGGAHNYHDANFLTFHRITNFRAKTMAESVLAGD